jgi:hypothetical protein
MRFYVDSKKNSDWLKHFAIDFIFDCLHVEKIKELLCVISFVEIESKRQKESSNKKTKKECRLRFLINIEKVDQFRTKAMRVWFKKSLRKESCLNRRRTRKKQLLSQKKSRSSDFRRRYHFYKFCKYCLVDWSLCSRQKLSKRLFSTNTILRSF